MIRIKNGSLFQWDINRIIETDDSENKICAIHCCQEGGEDALLLSFSRNGNKVEATIPNIFLQSAKSIYIYVVYQINEEVKTEYCKVLPVISRKKPSDYIYEETEVLDYNLLKTQIMQAVENKADLDDAGKLNSKHLPENIVTSEKLTAAVSTAISQAMENGELKGENYILTDNDKTDIADIVLEKLPVWEGGSSEQNHSHTIDPDLKLLILGDSILGRDSAKAWINGAFNCKIENYAVSGASLSKITDRETKKDTFNWICRQLEKFRTAVQKEQAAGIKSGEGSLKFHEPDAILIDGGANDFYFSAKMGKLSSSMPLTIQQNTVDLTTVMGGTEQLFYELSNYYPKAQKFFVIVHQVYLTNKYTVKFGKHKYWPTIYSYIRAKYTSESLNRTEWEIIYDKDGAPISSTSELKTAVNNGGTYVRDYHYIKTGTNANGDDVYEMTFEDENGNELYVKRAEDDSDIFDGSKLLESNIQGHYNFGELRENLLTACQRYGFKVIDIFNDSCINTAPTQNETLVENGGYWKFAKEVTDENGNTSIKYTSTGVKTSEVPTLPEKANPITVLSLDLFDWKGLHPTQLGYEIGYEPHIKEALRLATVK